MDELKDIQTVDGDANAHKVPVIWGNSERAWSFIEQDALPHVQEPKKLKLPLINVYPVNYSSDGIQYQVEMRTMFQECMNQIVEQLIMKFSADEYGFMVNTNLRQQTRLMAFGVSEEDLKVLQYEATLFQEFNADTDPVS
jgi:hypothetical protein